MASNNTFFSVGRCNCCDEDAELYLLSCLDKVCKSCLNDAYANENKCFCKETVVCAQKLVDCPESTTRVIFTMFEMMADEQKLSPLSISPLIVSKYVEIYSKLIVKGRQISRHIETLNKLISIHNTKFPILEKNIIYCNTPNMREMLNNLYNLDKNASDAEKWCAKMQFAINALKMMVMYEVHTQAYDCSKMIEYFMRIKFLSPNIISWSDEIIIHKGLICEFNATKRALTEQEEISDRYKQLIKSSNNDISVGIRRNGKYDMFEDDVIIFVRTWSRSVDAIDIMFYYKKYVEMGEDLDIMIKNPDSCIIILKDRSIERITFINREFIIVLLNGQHINFDTPYKINKRNPSLMFITNEEKEMIKSGLLKIDH